MGIINPEVGAIDQYLWVKAQEGIKLSLEAVRDAQKAINNDYDFDVHENLYRPTIEKIENKALVNILIAQVVSDANETNFDKTHNVTYNIDCYVRGRNEDDPDSPGSLVPADEVAVERLQYLCAMVEFGLTKLANFYQGLNSGEIIPDKIDLTFNPVDDAAEAATPYAPARFQFVCKFPYTPQDLENLPVLEQSFIDLSEWASRFIY
ncbi:hypothetical protein KAR91_68405 [Candidatus Pacearchaeota archaeon]|nr:hypothetical protein [Candidatus Pacearchaeota archaeon]